jgi:hypothetical protein
MDYDGNSEGNSDENDGIMIYIYIVSGSKTRTTLGYVLRYDMLI